MDPTRAAHEAGLDVGDVGSERYHHALDYLFHEAALLGGRTHGNRGGCRATPRLRALLLHSAGSEADGGLERERRGLADLGRLGGWYGVSAP